MEITLLVGCCNDSCACEGFIMEVTLKGEVMKSDMCTCNDSGLCEWKEITNLCSLLMYDYNSRVGLLGISTSHTSSDALYKGVKMHIQARF